MHPAVSYPLERVVPPDGVRLCGEYLPGGTIVGVNAAVIHRERDRFGQDADTFRPERWLHSSEERIKLMDRHNLAVSSRMDEWDILTDKKRLTTRHVVWCGRADVHRQEHLHHGDVQVRTAGVEAVRPRVGVERARVEGEDVLVC